MYTQTLVKVCTYMICTNVVVSNQVPARLSETTIRLLFFCFIFLATIYHTIWSVRTVYNCIIDYTYIIIIIIIGKCLLENTAAVVIKNSDHLRDMSLIELYRYI